MSVVVLSKYRKRGVSARIVRNDARRILDLVGERAAELSVSLVDDSTIHPLNCNYRGKDRPTDVLAFAMREGARIAGDESEIGDVVISLDTAQRQATERGITLADEVQTLLIHGILHLLGYDHERSAPEARRMKTKERAVKKALSA